MNQLISNCIKCYERNKQENIAESNKEFHLDGGVRDSCLGGDGAKAAARKVRSQSQQKQR